MQTIEAEAFGNLYLIVFDERYDYPEICMTKRVEQTGVKAWLHWLRTGERQTKVVMGKQLACKNEAALTVHLGRDFSPHPMWQRQYKWAKATVAGGGSIGC